MTLSEWAEEGYDDPCWLETAKFGHTRFSLSFGCDITHVVEVFGRFGYLFAFRQSNPFTGFDGSEVQWMPVEKFIGIYGDWEIIEE
jgi:hypothetical protein